ncbi:MAG: hypothetical protein JWM53_1776 [bacterium]|nr:hypothetical protein [bacterium]
MALVGGCSFNPGNSGDLGGGGGGDDLAGVDDLSPSGPDLTMVCTPGTKTCSGTMLSTCNLDGTATDTATCVLGCNATNDDCKALQPTAPAMATDFVYGGLSDPTIGAAQTLLVFDTDTGEIRDGSGAVVRMPNAAAQTRFVENGIGFHRVSGVGIWTFSKLTVPATTTIVFKNPFAASILSATDLTIAGTIDLRGYADPTKAKMTTTTLCTGTVAGPGGTIGGTGTTAAIGAGAGGIASDVTTGAGGGGYGDTGGAGGKNGPTNGGTAGAVTGAAAINPLAAGFGGGPSGGNGGGGGGALQLAAEGTITVSGTINAGGCGGAPGDVTHGGGGGGSGGGILIEAPTVHLTATGVLAANGGGGGAGGSLTATAGDPGGASNSQANGGAGLAGGHNGGSGGALGATTGQSGSNGAGAGGGGGGVGRVRLNSRSGGAIDVGSIVSPATTQGTVVIQ